MAPQGHSLWHLLWLLLVVACGHVRSQSIAIIGGGIGGASAAYYIRDVSLFVSDTSWHRRTQVFTMCTCTIGVFLNAGDWVGGDGQHRGL
jgi:predicted NAD/FAD-binding protein